MHCWRFFQKAINSERPEFNPEGLQKYWEEHGKEFNTDSIRIMSEIEVVIKSYIRERLEDVYDSKWINEIPQAVFTNASKLASESKYETGEDKDWWEFVTIHECKEIVLFGKNWSEIFSEKFTLDSEKKKSGGKKAKTEWMVMIDKLQKKAGKANFTVAKSEYQILCEVQERFSQV